MAAGRGRAGWHSEGSVLDEGLSLTLLTDQFNVSGIKVFPKLLPSEEAPGSQCRMEAAERLPQHGCTEELKAVGTQIYFGAMRQGRVGQSWGS